MLVRYFHLSKNDKQLFKVLVESIHYRGIPETVTKLPVSEVNTTNLADREFLLAIIEQDERSGRNSKTSR